jgi:TonB-dependent SusC/RagA subfamily outer membrane receptor
MGAGGILFLPPAPSWRQHLTLVSSRPMKNSVPAFCTALLLLAAARSGQAQNQASQPQHPTKEIRLACRPSLSTNQPLCIVDGVPLDSTSQLALLNPNDIEKVQVLKGAEATALFGSRGQYGVLIITSKRKLAPKPYPQRPMEAVVTP